MTRRKRSGKPAATGRSAHSAQRVSTPVPTSGPAPAPIAASEGEADRLPGDIPPKGDSDRKAVSEENKAYWSAWASSPATQVRGAITFLILALVVGTFAVLFYRVVEPLVIPIFVAAVVAMLAYPMQEWLCHALGDRPYVASSLVTTLLLAIVLIPIVSGMYLAGGQLYQAANRLKQTLAQRHQEESLVSPTLYPTLHQWLDDAMEQTGIEYEQVRTTAIQLAQYLAEQVYIRTAAFVGSMPKFFLDLFLFIVALYYFLADGRRILHAWDELTPMELEHDQAIRMEFYRVTRGVVWATLLAGVGQGVTFLIGAWVINLYANTQLGGWLILLTLATVVFSMVPVVGAAAVWVPVSIYFFLDGHPLAALALLLYGSLIISSIDNVIKVVAMQDSVDMHPLLLFLCVFGGMHLFGILGVFVGPMVGAVLVATLRILNTQLRAMETPALPG